MKLVLAVRIRSDLTGFGRELRVRGGRPCRIHAPYGEGTPPRRRRLTYEPARLVLDTALSSIIVDLTDLRFLDVGGARALNEARMLCSTAMRTSENAGQRAPWNVEY
ncbi:hypothetical protein [Cryptosporangium japonicum]|uniref:hypothetical protein n=1 Tax=Cryptosporangium japonicum TaxID=80872 RepID=UPI0031DF85D6